MSGLLKIVGGASGEQKQAAETGSEPGGPPSRVESFRGRIAKRLRVDDPRQRAIGTDKGQPIGN